MWSIVKKLHVVGLLLKKSQVNVHSSFPNQRPLFQCSRWLQLRGSIYNKFTVTAISVFLLQNGEWLAISPGGVREALFSDEYYTMIWNSRKGFAKVALEAKVVSTSFFSFLSASICLSFFFSLPVS